MREQNLWTRKTFFKYVYWTLGGLFLLSCLAGRHVVGHEMFIITMIIIAQALRIALRYIEIKRRKARLEEPIRVNLPRTADGQYVPPQNGMYMNEYSAQNPHQQQMNEQFDGRSSTSSGNSDGDAWKSIRPTSCCSKWLSNILIIVEVVIVIYCAIAVICLFCGMIGSIGRDNHPKRYDDEMRISKKTENHRLLQGIGHGEPHPESHPDQAEGPTHKSDSSEHETGAPKANPEGEDRPQPKGHDHPQPSAPTQQPEQDHAHQKPEKDGKDEDAKHQQQHDSKKDSKHHHDDDDEDFYREEGRERKYGPYQPGFFYYLLCMLFHAVALMRSLFNLKAFSKSCVSDEDENSDYRDPSNYYMPDQGYQMPVYTTEQGYNPHTGYAPRAPTHQQTPSRDFEAQQQPKRINLLDWRSPQQPQTTPPAPEQQPPTQDTPKPQAETQPQPQQHKQPESAFVGLSNNPPLLTSPAHRPQFVVNTNQRPLWDNRNSGLVTTDAKTAQMFVPKVKSCLICGHFLSREDQVKYLPNCGHIMHFACFARDVSAPVDQCPVCVYQRATADIRANNNQATIAGSEL